MLAHGAHGCIVDRAGDQIDEAAGVARVWISARDQKQATWYLTDGVTELRALAPLGVTIHVHAVPEGEFGALLVERALRRQVP